MAAAGAAGLIAVWLWLASRDASTMRLVYNVPIAAPFFGFLLERAIHARRPGPLLVDAAVVATALARVGLPVQGYSGHVLFLGFALVTARSVALRIASAAVLFEVLVIKLALWGDRVTVVGAAGLVTVAALLCRVAGPARRPISGARPPG